jgi:hypothetical protein
MKDEKKKSATQFLSLSSVCAHVTLTFAVHAAALPCSRAFFLAIAFPRIAAPARAYRVRAHVVFSCCGDRKAQKDVCVVSICVSICVSVLHPSSTCARATKAHCARLSCYAQLMCMRARAWCLFTALGLVASLTIPVISVVSRHTHARTHARTHERPALHHPQLPSGRIPFR